MQDYDEYTIDEQYEDLVCLKEPVFEIDPLFWYELDLEYMCL